MSRKSLIKYKMEKALDDKKRHAIMNPWEQPRIYCGIPSIKPGFQTIPTVGPWIADIRTCDIGETIAAAIRNAAPGCVAITLRPYGGRTMKRMAEEAAAKRGMRVIWLRLPTWMEGNYLAG